MNSPITKNIKVHGMTCHGSENVLSISLLSCEGVIAAKASHSKAAVEVTYDPELVKLSEINKTIEDAGFKVSRNRYKTIAGAALIAAVILAFLMLLRNTHLYHSLPKINQTMTLGVIFLVGLLTSIHCIGMCGGILLSQTALTEAEFTGLSPKGIIPSLNYNIGRVISYSLIGGIIGAIGSVLSFSVTSKGMIILISGLLVFIIGLQMLGAIPWSDFLPKYLPSFCDVSAMTKERLNNKPFIIGMLTGLMPCGPLQAAQLYALSTGSFVKGAVSMLVFSLGTVPLMFLLGALSTLIVKRFSDYMIKASAIILIVIGIMMTFRGFSVLNFFNLPQATPGSCCSQASEEQKTGYVAELCDGVQIVHTVVDENGYRTTGDVLRKGIPVKWIIEGKALDSNNNPIRLPKFGVNVKLNPGENIVYFTPTDSGAVVYLSWTGTINEFFTVVDEIK